MLVFSYCVDSLMSKLVVTDCVNCLVIQADSVIQNKHTHTKQTIIQQHAHIRTSQLYEDDVRIFITTWKYLLSIKQDYRLHEIWKLEFKCRIKPGWREKFKKKKKREKKLNKSSTQWQPLSSAVLMTLTCESHCSLPCLEWRLKVAATVTGSVYMRKRNKQTY